jgi:amidophosphoribosyltransferase
MPTRGELVAYGRTLEEINALIGSDQLIYQDVDDLKQAIRDINPIINQFEASCFDGNYITGNITSSYLDALEASRTSPLAMEDRSEETSDFSRSQLNLQLTELD